MAFDPSQFVVGFAGFVVDWVLTREWKRILLTGIPFVLLITVLSLVAWSSREGNNFALANWYLELGNEEIAEWEQAWAPVDDDSQGESKEASEDGQPGNEELREDAPEAFSIRGIDEERPAIPPFAFALFQRVQMLSPGDRSQYVIGAALSQQGALSQAEQLLTSIAPDEGTAGYAPAHLLLAQLYRKQLGQDPPKFKPLVLHHLKQATRWNRIPIEWLTFTVQAFVNEGRLMEALALQDKAAERDPAKNIGLAKLARKVENVKLAERASRTAEEYLVEKIEAEPEIPQHRIQLAELYLFLNKLDQAQQTLFDDVDFEPTPEFRRAQSQFFLFMFQRSYSTQGGKREIKVGLLDNAMRLDPTNPKVGEEIAKLAKVGLLQPNDAFRAQLNKFLVDGTATDATHGLLAETYLIQQDLKSAIPHLRQVVQRQPDAAGALNNLAFCLAEMEPDKIDEALYFAQRAIQVANARGVQEPEFFETYSMVLDKAGETDKAITAIETAITINKTNPAYHEVASRLYRKIGNDTLADAQAAKAEMLKQQTLKNEATQDTPAQPANSEANSK
ncbi:MAG TPA: hypothetical protein DDW52_19400 [Planctomycetaceae bacterium]|nr:hypothetical protein [Planctomycetaceae bacterium]